MCRFIEAMEAARTNPGRLDALCPKCGSSTVTTSFVTIAPEYARTCEDCGHEWAQRLND